MSEYKIKEEDGGCQCCGHGNLWMVVNSEDLAISTFYENEDDAQEMCDELNDAFERGLKRKEK